MNQRILQIASLVKQGYVLADIGTDHAQLPVFLVSRGITPKAYACDIAAGPLSSARQLIEQNHLEDRVIPVLSDGFDHVPSDARIAVIAGMGFITAGNILERAMNRLDGFEQIIVQVNKDTVELREWISAHHWTIEDECLIHDKGFWYTAVSFKAEEHPAYCEKEILAGPVLMQKKGLLFQEYCRHHASEIEGVLAKRNREDEKQEELRNQLAIWKSFLEA